MRTFLYLSVAAIAAFGIPIQAIVNGRLGQAVGNPFLAALVSFGTGTIILALLTVLWGGGLPENPLKQSLPWYLYTGGALGVVFVTVVLVLVPHVGAANVLAATIVGQLVMSLLVDHWGLLGIPREPISLVKIGGAGLLIFGTWLIQRG